MSFRRLAVPTYFGGLPGGYGYINNALVGTPSPAEDVKVGGPNDGTYFLAFGEDATSADFNRSAKALAANTDYLDDLLRRDVARVIETVTAVAPGGGVAAILLTGPGIFVGSAGTPATTEGIWSFVQVVDEFGAEIFERDAGKSAVTAIAPEAPGAGFSAGDVTLTISPPIPAGRSYRVRYGVRTNLATVPEDAYAAGLKHDARDNYRRLDDVTTGTVHSPSRDGALRLDTALGGADWDLQIPAAASASGWRTLLMTTGTVAFDTRVRLVPTGAEDLGNGAGVPYFLDAPDGCWWLVSDGIGWNVTKLEPEGFKASQPYTNFRATSIAADNMLVTDGTIFMDCALANPVDFTLIEPALARGRHFLFVDRLGGLGGNPFSLITTQAELIDGSLTKTFSTPYSRILLWCDGTNWYTCTMQPAP